MFGLSKSVTLALVGWLWADILLGLFVIFLAAASTPIHAADNSPSIDPQKVEITVPVDGAALAGDNSFAASAEQDRFLAGLGSALKAKALDARRPALVLAYGTNADPSAGERMAQRAAEALRSRYKDVAVEALHDIKAGDPGSAVALQIYFYR